MTRKILLFVVFVALGYGFWLNEDFKTITAGVAIFLLGMLSLEQGFKSFSGGVLEGLLQKTTDKTWKSMLFGMVSTLVSMPMRVSIWPMACAILASLM